MNRIRGFPDSSNAREEFSLELRLRVLEILGIPGEGILVLLSP